VVPTLPTLRNNNGNVMGYYYQDTVNTSLAPAAPRLGIYAAGD
jgi:hypothetical protein